MHRSTGSQAQCPASPRPSLPGQGMLGPQGSCPRAAKKTVAAAAEAGVCPVGWKGRVRLTRPQSTVAQPCSVTIFCSETAAFCKSTLRSLRKLRVHPAAKAVLRKPSQGLRPEIASEASRPPGLVFVTPRCRVERHLRAGLQSGPLGIRRVSSTLADGEMPAPPAPGEGFPPSTQTEPLS